MERGTRPSPCCRLWRVERKRRDHFEKDGTITIDTTTDFVGVQCYDTCTVDRSCLSDCLGKIGWSLCENAPVCQRMVYKT